MLSVPFVDLRTQYERIHPEVQAAMAEVFEASWFILGRRLESFEQAFASYCGGGEAVGVGSGTDALHLALRACGIGAGDEVITAAHSFIATALAIDYAGARPVFADIDPATGTLAPAAVAACLTPRTRAILPVHLYGQPAELGPLLEIARAQGLYVIEDACQAHGAEYQGRRVGALGDIGAFSFYPTKNLGAYGDGGLVLTRRPELAERVRLLRNYGQTQKYIHQWRGFNSRLDELQAAILEAKLAHLDAWNAARRRVAARYAAGIRRPGVQLLVERADCTHVYHLYVIRTPQRDALQRWLADHQIGTQIHYPIPIHRQAAYQDLGLPAGSLPETEKLAAECLSLPMYPELTDDQIDWVTATVNAFPG